MQAAQELDHDAATAGSAARLIREVHRNTRKRFSAEDKIRIVLEGFRRELPVTDLCRREGLSTALYYSWLKDFMEAGKARLKGDALRNATTQEVKSLRADNIKLKELVGEQALEMAINMKPDIVLMDIVLQGSMDGIETATRIRDRHDCKIIYITAHADNSTFDEASQTKHAGFVHKPFEQIQLKLAIEKALSD